MKQVVQTVPEQKGVSPWVIAASIAGLTVGGAVVYKLYFSKSEKEKNNEEVLQGLEQELATGSVSTMQPTFSNNKYAELSNSFYAAMEGIGTNHSVAYSLLNQLKNQRDWVELKAAYGTRKIWGMYGRKTSTLTEVILDEFRWFQMVTVKKILKERGIKEPALGV